MPGNPETTAGRLTVEKYNAAVDLWNAGQTLGQIADALGLGVYDLHPLTRTACREAMRPGVDPDATVKLEKIDV